MRLVSGSSLANHSDSASFVVVHALLSQEGFRKKDSGRLVGHLDCFLFPFDLSQILPGNGDLLVTHSLPRPPLMRQPMQMVTIGSGHSGQFWSAIPLTD